MQLSMIPYFLNSNIDKDAGSAVLLLQLHSAGQA
jgi:hypothetical protein